MNWASKNPETLLAAVVLCQRRRRSQGRSRRIEGSSVALNGEGVLPITVEIACKLKLSF